ncbi:MAG: excisionase family DNA-binding protein [Veillonellales bacterium]
MHVQKRYEWLTQAGAAEYLGVSRPKIYRLVIEGHLKAIKFSPRSDMRFLKSDLDEYVKNSYINAGGEEKRAD